MSFKGGLFITLYDEQTLDLYIQKGIYSFLMKPQFGSPSVYSRHFNALADYCCAREGTHIFFFQKRCIVYGGQVMGNKHLGSFYINGPYSPMGRKINAPLFWDETARYEPTDKKGIFIVQEKERCQPYVLIFKDLLGLARKKISTDNYYFKLGKYGYPLPSNAIQDMGFCTMSPGETKILLDYLEQSADSFYLSKDSSSIKIKDQKTIFNKNFGLNDIEIDYRKNDISSEAHLEASILANPELLPINSLKPKQNDILCRQIPISPFKPYQMDRADICYYKEGNLINEGTLPNTIIELKKSKVGQKDVEQVQRYLLWLSLVLEQKFKTSDIEAYIIAPDFSVRSLKNVSRDFEDRIKLVNYAGEISYLGDF